jgi:hypothetical protein
VTDDYAKIGKKILPREFMDDKVNGTGLYYCTDDTEIKEDKKTGEPEEDQIMYKEIEDK